MALVLSRDPTFANNTLVVYEAIPFDMPPGTTAYRDANNAIAFFFPEDHPPGRPGTAPKVGAPRCALPP